MIIKNIHLNEFYDLSGDPILEAWIVENQDSGFPLKRGMIVVPGGGYRFLSKREGDPVALYFSLHNYVTFILHYSINVTYPEPQLELLAAIDYLRKHSDELGLIKNKLSAIGFSAGGHLVASTAYVYKEKELQDRLKAKEEDLKLDAVALGYPVILGNKNTHQNTIKTITGGDKALIDLLSVDEHISNDFPPTFVWSTEKDDAVPILNTKILEEQLTKHNVKHKTVIFPEGVHGLALNMEITAQGPWKHVPGVEKWMDYCLDFLNEVLD